jgi:hypothetical protein
MNRDKDPIELDHLDNVKVLDNSAVEDNSVIEDLEPKLHWRTWAVVIACGILLFANNLYVTLLL